MTVFGGNDEGKPAKGNHQMSNINARSDASSNVNSDARANTLFSGDNLYVLHGLNSNSIDLIYLDPPFNSKRHYVAPSGSQSAGASFKDIWCWEDVDANYIEQWADQYPHLQVFINAIEGIHGKAMRAYLTYMTQRLVEMHRVLKPTGSLYLHVDPTSSHYLKIILDQIFGAHRFHNEIIWGYRTGGVSKKRFGRKHDVILFYTKSAQYTFHPMKERSYSTNAPPGFKNITKYQDADKRWYTLSAMRDIWEINALGRNAKERRGYPTQKPLALLKRIIEASSREGEVVLDPFCGCATTCVAAQQLGRKWIGIDIEPHTAQLLANRLSEETEQSEKFVHRVDIPQRADL